MLQRIFARLFRRRKPTADWSLDTFGPVGDERRSQVAEIRKWLKERDAKPSNEPEIHQAVQAATHLWKGFSSAFPNGSDKAER